MREWEGHQLVWTALHLGIPAVVVGLGAGLAAVGFRWLIQAATQVFSGAADYSATIGHPANPWVPWLGGAFVIIAPAIGGAIYGPLVQKFAPEARGHGVPEVMFAVAKNGGRIRPQVAVVKALASAITIGSGGSVGREGPIIQIGSALGSTLGRLLKMPDDRLKTLVACGAAGAIAATFNAPIAGVFFALEIILRDFTARSFGVVVLASISASVVGRALLGSNPFLSLPSFTVHANIEYALFALLGIIAGLVGVGFTRVLYAIEDLCDFLWRGPEWLRPVAGGLLLGGLLFVLPQMYGVGYPVLDNGVAGKYALGFLLVLLVGKIIATSLTLGIGGSGGVFAPSLFVGAMLGAAFGQVIGLIDPALAGQAGAFAIVGMGATMAGTTRAPITAGIMLFELTGDYSIILPLLLAIVLATGTSRLLGKDTIYTLKLRRRGIDLDAPAAPSAPPPAIVDRSTRRVADAMRTDAPFLRATEPLSDGLLTLLSSGRPALAVTDNNGRYLGVLSSKPLPSLASDATKHDWTVADAVVEYPVCLAPMTLADAQAALPNHSGDAGLPVVDTGLRLVGWLDAAQLAGPHTSNHPALETEPA
ncbi:chloride channel protein [Frondihabitans sp. PAMC 28766]|uniref:chloride channel protein n=1 Tax=Frondihabitans sp. PAMC 28766 TaxID=1795630 RepID=UPI001EF3E6ED|nr:chloride channel protein [Frondihabitans sp. PAMC 28766]